MDKISKNNNEKIPQTDIEKADFLLKKYPDFIKNIETFDPNKILVGDTVLTKVIDDLPNKIKDEFELMMAQHSARFLYAPKIEDIFENNRQARIDWIDEITNKRTDPVFGNFFTSNILKPQHMRAIVDSMPFIEGLPDKLVERASEIRKKVIPEKYITLTKEEKDLVVEETKKLATDFILALLSKNSSTTS